MNTNQVLLVGRLAAKVKTADGALITLTVDENNFTVYLYENIAENVLKFCQDGTIMGVKGHLADGNKVVADKITFLAAKEEK